MRQEGDGRHVRRHRRRDRRQHRGVVGQPHVLRADLPQLVDQESEQIELSSGARRRRGRLVTLVSMPA